MTFLSKYFFLFDKDKPARAVWKKDVFMEPTMKKYFMMVSQTTHQNKTFLSNNFFLFAKDLWAGAVWKKTSWWSRFWKLVFMLVSLTRLQTRTFLEHNIFLFQQFEKDVFLEPTVKNFTSPVSPCRGLYLDRHLPQTLRQAYDWGENNLVAKSSNSKKKTSLWSRFIKRRPYGADLKTLSFWWFYKLDFKAILFWIGNFS